MLQKEKLKRTHLLPTGVGASTGMSFPTAKVSSGPMSVLPPLRCPVVTAQGWRQVWPCDLTAAGLHTSLGMCHWPWNVQH